jgi:Na+-exporting ATPase
MNLDQVMSLERNATEKNLIFLGLAGIYDPPRPESAPAVEQCKQAGIVIHMATGDHPKTAFAIAREIGIAEKTTDKKLLLTASEFDGIPDDEIVASQRFPLVIARCSPTTKVITKHCVLMH